MGPSAALPWVATLPGREVSNRLITSPANGRAAAALAALRERTRAAHHAVERALIIARPGAGREEYARHVAALWGWMKPIEAMLWRGVWPARVGVGSRAVKTAWLEHDVAVARADGFLVGDLDMSGGGLPDASPAARFGIAYVVERSMLGGAVLLRRLGPRLTPWPARYLRGYGIHGRRYWSEFLRALDQEVTTVSDIDAAADAAARAFDDLGRWMRAHGAAE